MEKMIVYRVSRKPSVFKWILGGIVFVVTLCITFSEVSGAGLPF